MRKCVLNLGRNSQTLMNNRKTELFANGTGRSHFEAGTATKAANTVDSTDL